MSDMTLPDAVLHDRKVRRKMSRRAYSELVGISENRVHALEHGRKIKPTEIEPLAPHIGDLTDLGNPPAQSTAPPKNQPAPEVDPPGVSDETARNLIGFDYVRTLTALDGRIPPYPWPSQHRLETAPPADFPAIREWLRDVDAWIAEQDGTEPPAPEDEPSADDQEPSLVTDDVVDDVEDETAGDWVDHEPPQNGAEPEPAPEPESQGWNHPDADPLQDLKDTAAAIFERGIDYTPIDVPVLEQDIWHVTNGELQTFKDCSRRWYLQNYLHLGTGRKKLTGSAAVGTRYHGALATWYQPVPGDPWDQFNTAVLRDRQTLEDQNPNEDVLKQFETEVRLVRAMLEGYFEWVEETSADVGIRVVAPESVVIANPKIPGHENARLLAKLDAEIENEVDNSRGFIDHKTGQNFTDMIRKLQLDEQMQHYNLIRYLQLVEEGLENEIRVNGAIYNMARRVMRTATAQPPFYGRETVDFNMDQTQSYWLRVKGTMDRISEVRNKLDNGEDHREIVPPRPSNDCHWKCEFFALCPMMDHSPKGAQDYMNEVLVTVNPLARYEPEAVGVTM